MRLNAFIAKSGICARRQAAELVKEGRVKVGGKTILEPWHEVADADNVAVGGRRIRIEDKAYFILNKAKGITSTAKDRFAEKKITDIVPKKYGRLYPVGRLDRESRGLVILTNDGELCYRLTHPKFEVEKEYRVVIKGGLDLSKLSVLKDGINDEGEILKVKSYFVINSKKDKTELGVIISEGKKRHLRRLFKRIGLAIIDLVRIRIGGLKLGDLREGSFRKMSKDEIYLASK